MCGHLEDSNFGICKAKRKLLDCKQRHYKLIYRYKYAQIYEIFDRDVQKVKGLHLYNMQNELLNGCTVDSTTISMCLT